MVPIMGEFLLILPNYEVQKVKKCPIMQAQYKTPLRYGGTYHGVIFTSIVKLIHFFVPIVKSMHWWVGRRAKKNLQS